jgi:hypothetical protein
MNLEQAIEVVSGYLEMDPEKRSEGSYRKVAAKAMDQIALTPLIGGGGNTYTENVLRFTRPSHPLRSLRSLSVSPSWLEGGRWVPMNPSIVAVPDGYIVNYRLVNYRNRRASYYRLEADGVIRTRNVLQAWNLSGEVIGEYLLDLGTFASDAGPYQGLEDLRLVVKDGVLCFSASYAQLRPLPVPRIVYGRTDLHVDSFPPPGTQVHVVELTELMASPVHVCEKNWMPVVRSDGLFWIYSLQPFRILQWMGDGVADVQPIRSSSSSIYLKSLRGSVGPVEIEGRWLSLVHFYSTGDGRWYHHRWIQHDPDTLVPVAVSASFCFNPVADDAEVEFAAGLIVGRDGLLWVTYGKDDRESMLACISLQDVMTRTWYS